MRSRADRPRACQRPRAIAHSDSRSHARLCCGSDRKRADPTDHRCAAKDDDSVDRSFHRAAVRGSRVCNLGKPLRHRLGARLLVPAQRTEGRCVSLLRTSCTRRDRGWRHALELSPRSYSAGRRTLACSRCRSTHRAPQCARSWQRAVRTHRRSVVLDGQCPRVIPASRIRRCA